LRIVVVSCGLVVIVRNDSQANEPKVPVLPSGVEFRTGFSVLCYWVLLGLQGCGTLGLVSGPSVAISKLIL
jgi:hypothetical protein